MSVYKEKLTIFSFWNLENFHVFENPAYELRNGIHLLKRNTHTIFLQFWIHNKPRVKTMDYVSKVFWIIKCFQISYQKMITLVKLILNDCNGARTHNHWGRKRTLNHLAKLAKCLSCIVSTYLYGAFDCMFVSCHVRISDWIHTL